MPSDLPAQNLSAAGPLASAPEGWDPAPVDSALAALAPAENEFRSAVAVAHEEVRTYRARHEHAASDPIGVLAGELGPFAEGRLDPRRLVGLLDATAAPDPLTDRLMEEAHRTFDAIIQGGREAFHVVVPPGGDLRDAVRDALADLGRAFGTAHAVERARDHMYNPDEDYALLHPYPFHEWSPIEKDLAPPLVVEVDARDLRAVGLMEFLEGWQKIVLIVRGPAHAAPLARLVAPDTMVAQVPHGDARSIIAEMAAFHGPGVVGSFDADSGALPFVKRPNEALFVDRSALTGALAKAADTRRQEGIQDLQHLESLATMPAPVAPVPEPDPGFAPAVTDARAPAAGNPAAAGGGADVDKLAAWLLARTDLSGL